MDNQNLALETKTDLMLSKEYAERRELSSRLRKVILALSRGQRQTITLYYFGKLDISEIAGIFDCGENAVKAHLLLALGSIQTEIRELEQQSGENHNGETQMPFGEIFISQLARSGMTKERAAHLYQTIHT